MNANKLIDEMEKTIYNLQCIFRLNNSDVTTTNGDEGIIFAPVMFVR